MVDLVPVVSVPVDGSRAILLELAVDPQAAPYLVTAPESSSNLLMWIPRASREKRARSVIRGDIASKEDLFQEILRETIAMGEKAKWGNVQDLSLEGVKAAVEYLVYFGLDDVELLLHDSHREDENFKFLKGLEHPLVYTSWCPENTVVAIPKDREFVGFIGKINDGSLFCLVHNPSRGIAVAKL